MKYRTKDEEINALEQEVSELEQQRDALRRALEQALTMCKDAERMLAADQYDECWCELHQFNDCQETILANIATPAASQDTPHERGEQNG